MQVSTEIYHYELRTNLYYRGNGQEDIQLQLSWFQDKMHSEILFAETKMFVWNVFLPRFMQVCISRWSMLSNTTNSDLLICTAFFNGILWYLTQTYDTHYATANLNFVSRFSPFLRIWMCVFECTHYRSSQNDQHKHCTCIALTQFSKYFSKSKWVKYDCIKRTFENCEITEKAFL